MLEPSHLKTQPTALEFFRTPIPKRRFIGFAIRVIKTLELLIFKVLDWLDLYHPQKSIVGIPSIATKNYASLQAVVYNGTQEEVLGFRPRRWLYRLIRGVPDVEMFERVRFQLDYSEKLSRIVEASTETRGFIHLQIPWQLPRHTSSETKLQLKTAGVETLLGRTYLGRYEIENPSVYFLNEKIRWVVISDIDDTIKDSNIAKTTSFRSILSSVFLGHYYTYQAITGMAQLYQNLVNSGAMIVYLTSTPYQLAPFLLKFLKECNFPEGPVFPRWLGYGKQRHKWKAINRILSNLGDQKCILIGDSGEMDLQIYRRICENKAFSEQVHQILIRQVPGTPQKISKHPRETIYRDHAELKKSFLPILQPPSHSL